MNLQTIMLLCAFSGCGAQQYESSPELEKWVQLFEEEALDHGIDVKGTAMVFTNDLPEGLLPSTIGYCQQWSNGARLIKIVERFWRDSRTDDMMRYSLLLHEQGHCTFNLDHTEGGIMNHSLIYPTDEMVEEFWKQALEQGKR